MYKIYILMDGSIEIFNEDTKLKLNDIEIRNLFLRLIQKKTKIVLKRDDNNFTSGFYIQ
jgi:hypothetical protein